MPEKFEKWEVYISKDDFEVLKHNKKFVALLNLARIVNQLNFCFQSLIEANASQRPSERRKHVNALLFSCGVLYEGLKVANTLGKHFGEFESFQKGFGVYLKNAETKQEQEKLLNLIRNKIVFHIDDDKAGETLRLLDFEEYVFIASSSSKSGEMYYQLADEIAINVIVGHYTSKTDELKAFEAAITEIVSLLKGFIRSADILFAETLKEMGWQSRML